RRPPGLCSTASSATRSASTWVWTPRSCPSPTARSRRLRCTPRGEPRAHASVHADLAHRTPSTRERNTMSLNLASFLRDSAFKYPKKPALIVGESQITFETAHAYVQKFAGALQKLGVSRGQ